MYVKSQILKLINLFIRLFIYSYIPCIVQQAASLDF